MNAIWQDVRFGWRMARRRPLVTGVALLSLGIGISMSAVVFNLLDAAVLRPLPVHDSNRLVLVLNRRGPDDVNHNFSYPDFVDYRTGQHGFTDLIGYSRADVTIRGPAGPKIVPAELVTGGYFATLGVRLRFGRGLTDADDRPDAPPAVVVSDALWHTLTGAADVFSVRTLIVNAREFAVVGVVQQPFRGMQVGRDVRIWAAMHQQPLLDPSGGESYLSRRGVSFLTMVGRLGPDVTSEAAAADLNRLETGLRAVLKRQETRALILLPGGQGDSGLPKSSRASLQMLLGAALLVLLVACANVANLLLARATERHREIAVRTALGAGRGRIARLLFIEALLLGCGGSAIALIVAVWGARLAVPLLSTFGAAVVLDVGMSWPLFAFVTALGVGTTVLAGLAPVLNVARLSPAGALGDGGRPASAAPTSARLRRGLVVSQFALCLALVVTSLLLVRTLLNLRSIPSGFDIDHIALLAVDPTALRYDASRTRAYYADAERLLAQVPGVRAAGYGRVIPIGFGGSRSSITIPGYQPKSDEDMEINFNVVSPAYFESLGMTLLDGRGLAETDILGQPLAAVVNETMAKRYWAGMSAVGREFHFGDERAPLFRVVGVARDVKYRMLREEAGPSFYYSVGQTQQARAGVIHVRTTGDPGRMLDTLRRALVEADPAVPIGEIRTLRQQADLNVADERVSMLIGVSLAGAALLLAAVGLYAAMSCSVGQRRREIGVRVALGAVPRDIRQLVLGQGLRLALVGSLVGVALAVWIGRLVEAQLFGVTPNDAVSFLIAAALLAAVALLATWAPARRAARVDPVETLRMG